MYYVMTFVSVCQCLHGVCDHGVNGGGFCDCDSGYKGDNCDVCEYFMCHHSSTSVSVFNMTMSGRTNCSCLSVRITNSMTVDYALFS